MGKRLSYKKQLKLLASLYIDDDVIEDYKTHISNIDASIGEELPSDLIVLCKGCHAKFHDKLEVGNVQET